MHMGFITGVKKEAEILGRNLSLAAADIVCAGANPEQAYQLAGQLAERGCDVLISFGIAGALDPALKPGDLILANAVINDSGTLFETDPALSQRALSSFAKNQTISSGPLLGTTKIISDREEKQRLHQASKASAIDMESLGVARAASEHNCRFLVIRAIADTAEQTLPEAALSAIDDNGNIQIGRVLWDLAKNPAELPSLLKLAGNSRKAFASLRRVAASGFGF